MKTLLLMASTAIAATLFALMPAHAGEGRKELQLLQFTSASGISDAPCSCVVEMVETDPDLANELYSYATKDEFDTNASGALRELIGPCIEG